MKPPTTIAAMMTNALCHGFCERPRVFMSLPPLRLFSILTSRCLSPACAGWLSGWPTADYDDEQYWFGMQRARTLAFALSCVVGITDALGEWVNGPALVGVVCAHPGRRCRTLRRSAQELNAPHHVLRGGVSVDLSFSGIS